MAEAITTLSIDQALNLDGLVNTTEKRLAYMGIQVGDEEPVELHDLTYHLALSTL